MPHTFATYTDASLHALEFNPKKHEIVSKKMEILSSIAEDHGGLPKKILIVGFNPCLLSDHFEEIYVTEVSADAREFLDSEGIKYKYIERDELGMHDKAFDWTVAGDEYFTFAEDEDEQRSLISTLIKVTKHLIVTTLRDYKNQDFKDREFSQPLAVRGHEKTMVFLEFNDYPYKEKNHWKTNVYQIEGKDMKLGGPFARSSMYFKQLAKFSIDAGAHNFLVHKNLMYKGLIKKNYEHVISILVKKHGHQ